MQCEKSSHPHTRAFDDDASAPRAAVALPRARAIANGFPRARAIANAFLSPIVAFEILERHRASTNGRAAANEKDVVSRGRRDAAVRTPPSRSRR